MVPKYRNSDGGNWDMPERSHKVLLLSEKVKVFNLLRKEKQQYAAAAKIYGKNKSSVKL